MAFLQELADLRLEPKSEAEIDALMTAAAQTQATRILWEGYRFMSLAITLST